MQQVLDIDQNEAFKLFGQQDKYLKLLHSKFPVKVVTRGGNISVSGEPSEIERVSKLLSELLAIVHSGHAPSERDWEYAMGEAMAGNIENLRDVFSSGVKVSSVKPDVKARTRGQREYIEAIEGHDIVFGVGPAGTGKTFLAMAMALSELRQRKVSRVVLTRPAVEAGESLGFLPGDLEQKINPYLRPLYDALYEMAERTEILRLMERGQIEIAPLAYMRGRTLNSSFVVLDEAQNTTTEQMKMFLTRLGGDSRAVVTGDITQIDLPAGKKSGLIEAGYILSETTGIAFVRLDGSDVVRHRLVRDIIEAYGNKTEKTGKGKKSTAEEAE
ncbi:PhoH family protein [Candidatus Hydrogenedentota bacterium]